MITVKGGKIRLKVIHYGFIMTLSRLDLPLEYKNQMKLTFDLSKYKCVYL